MKEAIIYALYEKQSIFKKNKEKTANK